MLNGPAAVTCAAVMTLSAVSAAAQPPAAAQDPNAALLRQASQQMREGHEDQAIATAREAVSKSPYVLGLLAQAYEKLGEKDKAIEYYRKVLASTTHNPTTAGSRPLAKKKLAELSDGR